MSEPGENRYDLVPYPSSVYHSCHPDRLCVVGRIFGLATPDPRHARILEIGCGSGGNLVPVARSLPEAEVVGVDLSQRAVEAATARIARFDVRNARVERRDILQLDANLGTFDYILCHGVYSWVPDPVRDALFVALRGLLAPTGVAYVSYNTYPGWHLHGVARDLMRFHATGFDDPAEQVDQGRAFVRFAAEANAGRESAWAKVLKESAEVMGRFSTGYYYHDFLAPENSPCLLSDFVARARGHGLNYLGDSSLASMMATGLAAEVRQKLDSVTNDLVQFEQYLDLVRGTSFRRTLLCQREATPQRHVRGQVTAGLYAVICGRPQAEPADPAAPGPMTFLTWDDSEVKVDDALTKAALLALHAGSPREIAIEELVEQARATIGGTPEDDLGDLGASLIHAFAAELVELVPRRRQTLFDVTERPLADAYARGMAADGEDGAPNVRHELVSAQRFDRELLRLCDGTRTQAELVDGLIEAAGAGRLSVSIDAVEQTDPAVVREAITLALPLRLKRLLQRGLLVG